MSIEMSKHIMKVESIVFKSDSNFYERKSYFDKEKRMFRLFSLELMKISKLLKDESGIYKLYDKNKDLIYLGKSHNLSKRIKTSSKKKKAEYFSYTIIENKADTNIYEMYYIAKIKPKLNKADKVKDYPSFDLPKLEFTKKIKAHSEYTEEGVR